MKWPFTGTLIFTPEQCMLLDFANNFLWEAISPVFFALYAFENSRHSLAPALFCILFIFSTGAFLAIDKSGLT